MDGAIGIHIEANSPGYSRDRVIDLARKVGGKYATVVNDPTLCLMLLGVGVTPIYRINRNPYLDDNAHQRGYKASEYLRLALTEVNGNKGVSFGLNNEPGQADLERLRDWMLEGIAFANSMGMTLVCLNWSYGNPREGTEDVLRPLYQAIASGKHIYACHEGTDLQHPTLASCTPDLIGRFLDVKRRYGFKVLVTEFAASLDAYHGWQTWNSNFANVCADTMREVYAPNGVHMTPFTAFKWQEGFDYIDSPLLLASWAETNRRFPVMNTPDITPSPDPNTLGAPVLQVVTETVGLVANVRADTNTKSAIITTVKEDDTVLARPTPTPRNGYTWRHLTQINGVARVGWLSNVATLGDPPMPDEPPIVHLADIPFVSQLGQSAHLRNNDCHNAVAQSVAAWKLDKLSYKMPLLLWVDGLLDISPLATDDNPVTVNEALNFCEWLGVEATWSDQLRPPRIIEELDKGYPVELLGNYGQLNPGQRKVGHWFLVVGYTENSFIINDTYLLGENVRISKRQMELVQTDLTTYSGGTFASKPYQGFTFS